MIVEVATAKFRPVTVTFETQDEFDKLEAVLEAVIEKHLDHRRNIVDAAKELQKTIFNEEALIRIQE